MRALRDLRTLLYVPASSASSIERAVQAGPDAIIVDLEDSVTADDKELARHGLPWCLEVVRGAGIEPIIRVNGADTIWHGGDIEAAAALHPLAVLLPKASTESVVDARDALGRCAVLALLETARDVLSAHSIAGTPGVGGLVIGYGDLSADLGLERPTTDAPAMQGARHVVVGAATAASIACFDGVVIGDHEAARVGGAVSSRAGFDGRTLYDPRHIAPCAEAFREYRSTS